MSNDYFQFKQFRVEQEMCAMKVTTDACIQGAWTPVLTHLGRVLDVGTGTGLLALMLAQRSDDAIIDALEIDPGAARQAAQNAAASPWKDRINVIACDVRHYAPGYQYDLVIANPPFFNNSLLSNDAAKDAARHTLHLSYDELLAVLKKNIAKNGYASVMLPAEEYRIWHDIAKNGGLYEACKLSVSHTNDAPVKRIVGIFSYHEPSYSQDETLAIMTDGQQYSQEFAALLSAFYLGL